MKTQSPTVCGIDLAGASHRPSGVCVLKGDEASTRLLHSDDEILGVIQKERPLLVAIDAPLSLPPGRRSIHSRNGHHFRPCDLELRRRKIPFFPITLGPMRRLTDRGIALSRKIAALGFWVLEVYPGGAQDVWKIPRARRDLDGLREGLERMGLRGFERTCTDHELDAATAALVARLHLEGRTEVLGSLSSGAIIMPRPSK